MTREKRKSCKRCGGLGSTVEKTVHTFKNRDGTKTKIVDYERVKCRKCKGSGLAW